MFDRRDLPVVRERGAPVELHDVSGPTIGTLISIPVPGTAMLLGHGLITLTRRARVRSIRASPPGARPRPPEITVQTADAARTRQSSALRLLLAALTLPFFAILGPTCVPPDGSDPGAGSGSNPPIVRVTLNGISDETNATLIVPPSGFVVNVDWDQTDAPIDPDSLSVTLAGWSGGVEILRDFVDGPDGAWLIVPEQRALSEGSHTVYATLNDVEGKSAQARYSFVVRDFEHGIVPIGTGQQIWFDFDVDRDATPGADFDVDLELLGFASNTAPAWMNAAVRNWIITDILERVREVYAGSNPARIEGPDPIAVGFSATDLGLPDTTRICVGGEDPTGGNTLGNVLLDRNNAQRAMAECGTIPPTGVYPREIVMYAGQAEFQTTIDPLRPAAGGTPVGMHADDAQVLDPTFDPAVTPASPAALARHVQVSDAVRSFSQAMGTVLAHEAGHALGLVPESAPGVGLYGGDAGARYAHNEMPDGSPPSETWLMNHGGQFSFAELTAMSGHAPAEFRPLNHAYLRDRVVLAAEVTAILPPPTLDALDPPSVTAAFQTIRLFGAGFEPTPDITLSNPGFTYEAIGEQFVDDTEITAAIIKGQVVPGVYDVTLVNPDGQTSFLPSALTIE